MNLLRFPSAQICQRARTNPSQATKAITPATIGRSSLGHADDVRCRTDSSSSDVEVSCKASASTVAVRREALWQSWTRRPRPDAEPTRAMPDYPVRVHREGE